MTASALDAKYFTPHFDPPAPRKLSWIGRIVHWVHDAKNYNVVYRASVVALAIFASIAMILSVIGIPLYILFQNEFTRQKIEASKNIEIEELIKQSAENARTCYLQGLHATITDRGNIFISPEKRKAFIEELQIPEENAKNYSSIDLLKSVACKHPDWIHEYGFRVESGA